MYSCKGQIKGRAMGWEGDKLAECGTYGEGRCPSLMYGAPLGRNLFRPKGALDVSRGHRPPL